MTTDQILTQYQLVSSQLSAFLSSEKHLHPASFIKPHELKPLLSDTLDGTHLLIGESLYHHVLRVKPTEETPELGHVWACGSTGSGKSTYLISQLLVWPHSALVNDPKGGELLEKTGGYRRKIGDVFVLSPMGKGNQFDPFHGLVTEDKLYAMATQLLYEPNEKDPIFTKRAIKMLTQIFLAARLENQAAGYEKYRLLPYVRPLLRLELKDIARKIYAISPDLAMPFLDGKIGSKGVDENRFLQGAWEGLTAKLYPLLTDNVIRCFNGSDFTVEDILYSKKPLTIYLQWPEADLLALAPLVRLVWHSLLNGLSNTYDNTADKNRCQRGMVFFEEAGRTEVPELYHYLSTFRSRKYTFVLSFQSPAQMEASYGKARAGEMKDNCETELWWRPASYDTAAYLAKWLGDKSGFATSESKHEGGVSNSSSEREIPLMTPQQLRKMKNYQILIWHRDIGPILTTSLRWYRYPHLQQRKAIPPPILQPLPPVEDAVSPIEPLTPSEPETPPGPPEHDPLPSWHYDPNLFRRWRPTQAANKVGEQTPP
jgi:type IV secretion system protein VirD4